MCVLLSTPLLFCGMTYSEKAADETWQPVHESIARNIALQKISDCILQDPTCAWSADTMISEVVITYDLMNDINGYIFNLTTNGNDSGYIFVNCMTDMPGIAEFGYTGKYYILERQDDFSKTQKLLYLGSRAFAYRQNGQLYAAETGTRINVSNSDLVRAYNTMAAELEEALVTESRQTLSASATSQIIYSSHNVLNAYYPNSGTQRLQPVTTGDFPEYSGHCASVCVTNLLTYWQQCRGISNIMIDYSAYATFYTFATYLNHYPSSPGGTNPYTSCTEASDFIEDFEKTAPAGSDYRWRGGGTDHGFDWAFITNNFNNNNAMYLSISTEYYGNHAVLGIGYQNANDGQYIRIADGWYHDLSHFISYTYTNVNALWYLRW